MVKLAPARGETSSKTATYAERYVHGAFWSLTGTLGLRFFNFTANIIVARFLGQIGFGELAMIQSTIGFLETFSNLGLTMTATKYVAELRLRNPERTGRVIGLTYLASWTAGILMAFIGVSAAPWLATKTLNAPYLVPELRLASLVLLVSTGFGPQIAILAGFHSFRTLARINIAQGLLNLPLMITLAWYGGLRGIILAMLVTSLAGAVLAALALFYEYRKHQIHPNFLEAWKERSVFWQFSLPAFLAGIVTTPVIWVANAILVNQPGGYAQLGLFRAASQFQFLIRGVDNILAQVSVPTLAEIFGRHNRERFAQAFNLNFKFIWSLVIALGFFYIGFSHYLIRLFGERFQAASTFLPLVLSFTVINAGCGINGQVFYSSGKMWISFILNLSWGIGVILLCIIFVPLYKGHGLVISYTIAFSLLLIFQMVFLKYIFTIAVFRLNIISLIFSIFLLGSGIIGYYYNYHVLYCIINVILSLLYIAISLTDNQIKEQFFGIVYMVKKRYLA